MDSGATIQPGPGFDLFAFWVGLYIGVIQGLYSLNLGVGVQNFGPNFRV